MDILDNIKDIQHNVASVASTSTTATSSLSETTIIALAVAGSVIVILIIIAAAIFVLQSGNISEQDDITDALDDEYSLYAMSSAKQTRGRTRTRTSHIHTQHNKPKKHHITKHDSNNTVGTIFIDTEPINRQLDIIIPTI